MRRARAFGIAVIALGAVSHLTRAVGAATSVADPQWLSLRSTVHESRLLDRSRVRLLEQETPFHSTAAGARELEFQAILARVAPQTVRHTQSVVRLAPDEGGAATQQQAAASSASHGEVTKALNTFQLTPIQRLSIRDYVGEKKAEIVQLPVNGKELLILRDPKTHEYIGEATISVRDDGSVVVTKLTGATFSTSSSAELPISARETEQAEQVLGGSRSLKTFNSETEAPGGIELSIPAISLKGSMEYGPVAESVAVFRKDGSGYERGMRTNLAAVTGGVEGGASGKSDGDGFVGVKAGAASEAFKVELFANYFSAPEADEKGEFTRSVLGASGEAHVTLAELAGQIGCFEDSGCGAKVSAGLLGIGTGFGFNYGANIKLDRGSSAGIPEEGLASSEEQFAAANQVAPVPGEQPVVPNPVVAPVPEDQELDEEDLEFDDEDGDAIDDAEQEEFEAALEDGSVEALEDFLNKYPDSVYEADVREIVEDAQNPSADAGDETLIY